MDDRGLTRSGKKIPLYVQTAQLLRQGIIDGSHRDMLPSEISLSELFGVSPSVVRNALGMLREEGWIVTQHGSGSRIVRRPDKMTITARPGDSVRSRMPTRAEREALGLAEGIPVIELRRAGAAEAELHSALTTTVAFAPGHGSGPAPGEGAGPRAAAG